MAFVVEIMFESYVLHTYTYMCTKYSLDSFCGCVGEKKTHISCRVKVASQAAAKIYHITTAGGDARTPNSRTHI